MSFGQTPYKKTDLVALVQESAAKAQAFDWDTYLEQQKERTEERGAGVVKTNYLETSTVPVAGGGSANDNNEDVNNDAEDGGLVPPHVLKVQAPMVRCSRPPFRHLCRLYGTDISYSHMIMSDSFVNHSAAREADFAVYEGEEKLICQLAGTNPENVGRTAELLSPYCDAVDINCGCPQRWAMKEGIGAAMMNSPQLVADIVKSVRNQSGLPCVVKHRVFKDDDRRTVDFCRQVVAAGASWLTVHGRTWDDNPSAPVRYDSIKVVKSSVPVPIIVNGSIETYQSVIETASKCQVGGVMSARALLDNPATFCADYPTLDPKVSPLPKELVSDYMRLAIRYDGLLQPVRHHLLLMMHQMLTPSERIVMTHCNSLVGLLLCLKQTGYWTDKGRFTPPPVPAESLRVVLPSSSVE